MLPSVHLVSIRGLQIRSSQILSRAVSSAASSSNDEVNPNFVNRNPRNMEMLRIGRKPQGWNLDTPTKNYWYKVVLEHTQKNITARVEHFSGVTVVSASTKEWAIKQHLYSKVDVSAAENIGRILAQRCLESGITEMHTDLKQLAENSEKVRHFISALEEDGICLEEPHYIAARHMYRWVRYLPTLPWHILEEEVLKEDEQRALKKDKKTS